MTGSNDPPGGAAGPSGRRRPPTLDLTATEVAADASAPPDPAAGAAQPADGAATSGPARRAAFGLLTSGMPWPLLAAAGAGAALTVAALALAGTFSSRDNPATAADARLARLERQLRELAARPQPAASDPSALDDLAGRLARLETVVAMPKPPITDPALANRLATLDGDLRALSERIGVLARRSDEIASAADEARARADAFAASLAELRKLQSVPAASPVGRADLDALAGRLAALERAIKSVESALGQRVSADSGADRALRLVVLATALQAAVERGIPFAAELAAARAVAPDPKALAALDPFASMGVPTTLALARELTVLIPSIAKAVGTPSRGGGILDRLRASAERIVTIRPIDEAPGDDPAAIVRRIEIRAEQGNLDGAVAEIAKLPEAARAVAKEWVARAQARNAAIESSQRFSASTLASIGKPSL